MQQRILVIEDDPDIARLVRADLEDAGYRVKTAASGTEGLIQARTESPDLVILDLGLPDMDGSEVARRLRKTSPVPILILSAMDAVDRKVSLLDAGASDYVTKPFHPDELLARVHVRLRRQQNASGEDVTVGPVTLSLPNFLCRVDGREVALSRREFELLRVLALHPGRVFSREDIIRELWPDGLESSSNVVDVHLSNLRAKLADVGVPRLIRTVRGFGYALHVPA